eukprot:scaffold4279_cov99-Isochrysis_galbana.AAC.11
MRPRTSSRRTVARVDRPNGPWITGPHLCEAGERSAELPAQRTAGWRTAQLGRVANGAATRRMVALGPTSAAAS